MDSRAHLLSRGWADLSLVDDASDCLSIGDVNHHALFKRVGAVVHHVGAGTMTAAALGVALAQTLEPGVAVRAKSIAAVMRRDGAQIAAQRLVDAVK